MINLESYFKELDAAEIFYLKYLEAKNNKLLSKFMVANENLLQNEYWIPEYKVANEIYISEKMIFTQPDSENIKISKHCRFSPNILHSHEFIEIVYVLNGYCKNIIEFENIDMGRGDICFIAPGTRHMLNTIDNSLVFNILVKSTTLNDTLFARFLSNDNVLSDFFNPFLYHKSNNCYCYFKTKGDKQLESQLRLLISEGIDKKTYSNLIVDSLFFSVIGYLLRSHSYDVRISNSRNSTQPHVAMLLRYIHNNYDSISLHSLAQKFGYTEAYVSNLIRTSTGCCFTDIVRDIRLNNACNYLTSTKLTVSEISQKIGYQNSEHFFRIFKEAYGITPSEYRKNHGDLK